MRQILIDAFLDYKNNYSHIRDYAKANGLNEEEAHALINVARSVYYGSLPEA